MGRILGTTVARASDPEVRAQGTDGGVVTALLLHLFDLGRIDGAIVTRKVGAFRRWPWLAVTREEIKEAAGFHFDTMQGMTHFSKVYSALLHLLPVHPGTGGGGQKAPEPGGLRGHPLPDQFPAAHGSPGDRAGRVHQVPSGPVLHRQLPFRPGTAAEAGENRRLHLGRGAQGQRQRKVDDPSE